MSTTSQIAEPKKRNKISVYCLASPEDQDECKAIQKYLSPVIRNSQIPIEISSDFVIPAGEDTEKYKQKLYEADIVLAFISADFINDDETYSRTQKVMTKYNNHETIMLPILVRNCLWKSTPFVNLPLLPRNFQPLNNKQFWNSEDDALTAVVSDIYDSISAFSNTENYQVPGDVEIKNTPSEIGKHSATMGTEALFNKQQEPLFKNSPRVTPAIPQREEKATAPLNIDWRKQYYKDAFWKRGVAFFLDNLLTLTPVTFIAFAIASVSVIGTAQGDEVPAVSDDQLSIIMFFTLASYFIVCAAMESSRWRGTFGKRIMKLQITDKDGHPISFFRALWRNVLRFVTGYSYLLVIPLIIQYFTFRKTRQLFHDQLSYTVIGEKLSR